VHLDVLSATRSGMRGATLTSTHRKIKLSIAANSVVAVSLSP
jgi:hypothetical protein